MILVPWKVPAAEGVAEVDISQSDWDKLDDVEKEALVDTEVWCESKDQIDIQWDMDELLYDWGE